MKYEHPITEIVTCDDVIATSLTATTGLGEYISLDDFLKD